MSRYAVPGHVDPELLQRMRQLDTAARHPWMVLPFDADFSVFSHLQPRLVRLFVTQHHMPSHHQRLRARPAFGEAAFDEQLVYPDFRFGHCDLGPSPKPGDWP